MEPLITKEVFTANQSNGWPIDRIIDKVNKLHEKAMKDRAIEFAKEFQDSYTEWAWSKEDFKEWYNEKYGTK